MNEWMTTATRQDEELRPLKEYLAVVRRRKWYLVVPTVLILAAAVAVAVALPPVYRSTGKILIEQQEIPREWVPATVTSFADQRIQTISQRVLTTANLTRVIDKLNLYIEERREHGTESILQRMRDNFSVETISAKVRDPQSGRSGVATIAFSVSFEHQSPSAAQKIANELVSLYLEENVKTRTEAVADTTRFLEEEARKLADQLATTEARIAAFKNENMGRLPEQQDLNLQLMQRAEQALVETRRQIQSMEDRRTFLQSALGQMQARPAGGSRENGHESGPDLSALRLEYASLSGIYAEDHPDLVRLRRKIDALEQQGISGGKAAIENRLQSLRAELSEVKERYAGDHPDVTRLQNEIAVLEKQLERAQDAPPADASADPILIKTRADLSTVENELESLHQQADKYAQMVQALENRIADTPKAEQEYRSLVRDYENLRAKYRDIRAKQSSARVAEALEEDRKGERFSLIEPPQLPQEPIEPNRYAIVMLGFAMSLFGGLGAVVTRELVDDGVRTTRAVVQATSAPVLAAIPVIDTAADRRRTRRLRLLIGAGLVLCVAAVAVLAHFYYKPLDLLWYDMLRRLEQLQDLV